MGAASDLSTLTWTTREEVAAHLARFLKVTRQGPAPALNPESSLRVRATDLLGILKAPAQQNVLRTLALDAQDETEVRRAALRGLARLAAGITDADLTHLLADESLRDEDDEWFGPQDLLILARQPDAQDVALRYLRGLTPEERTRILTHAYVATSTSLLDWMYARWLNEDRFQLAADRGPASANEWAIRMTLDRPESRGVLLEMWREASGAERRRLLKLLDSEETDWSLPGDLTPAENAELTEALALPVEALLKEWGRDRLFQVLERELLAEHERKLAGRRLRTVIKDEAGTFLRALRVLRNWGDPAVGEWIAERAAGSDLDEEVRSWLMMTLWDRDRVLFSQCILRALETGDQRLARFIRWTDFGPREADRPALRAAARAEYSSELQYYALCGLERLGEMGPAWEERLAVWSRHPEPRLRIRALAAFARRGDPAARDALLQWAEGPYPLPARAEAISALGGLDAAAFLPLLVGGLALEEQAGETLPCAPVAEEAALVLARLGTPVALTALIQSYLSAETPYLQSALEEYLTEIVDAEPGTSPDLSLPRPRNWRSVIRPPWEGPEPLP